MSAPISQTKANHPEIFQRMSAAMAALQNVEKDKEHAVTHKRYASSEAIMEAVHAALTANGIVLEVETVNAEYGVDGKNMWATVELEVRFYAPDGSMMRSRWRDHATSSGSDRAMSIAHTYAFKYVLAKTFCIPVEEGAQGQRQQQQYRSNYQQPRPAPEPVAKAEVSLSGAARNAVAGAQKAAQGQEADRRKATLQRIEKLRGWRSVVENAPAEPLEIDPSVTLDDLNKLGAIEAQNTLSVLSNGLIAIQDQLASLGVKIPATEQIDFKRLTTKDCDKLWEIINLSINRLDDAVAAT